MSALNDLSNADPKRGAAFRIVAFGTSITARGLWLDVLAAHLSERLTIPVDIVKVAQGGATSDWAIERVGTVLRLHPDLVLVEFAINDADLRNLMPPSRSRRNTQSLVQAFKLARPAIRVMLITTGPAFGARGWLRPRLPSYYRQYGEIAAAVSVEFVDLASQWALLSPERLTTALPDGLHPTDGAMIEIAVPAITEAIHAGLSRRDNP